MLLVNNKLVKNKLESGQSKKALSAYFIVLFQKGQKSDPSSKEIA